MSKIPEMRVDRSFEWLGRFPLAVDLADTVRVIRGDDVELLVDDEALAGWVTAELPRFPLARAALGRLAEVRSLRDAVRSVLHSVAQGTPLSRRDIDVINDASQRGPSFPVVNEAGDIETVEIIDEPFDAFSGQVARSTFEVINHADSVAVCAAPSCGMLFVPESRRQTWCSPRCGNRARVARHAARVHP